MVVCYESILVKLGHDAVMKTAVTAFKKLEDKGIDEGNEHFKCALVST